MGTLNCLADIHISDKEDKLQKYLSNAPVKVDNTLSQYVFLFVRNFYNQSIGGHFALALRLAPSP